MKSDHHNHLRKAIRQLPEYEAPPEIWQNISSELDESGSKWLSRILPVYKAPDFIWTSIAAQLDRPRPILPSVRKLYRYAAIFTGIALGGFLLVNYLSGNNSEQLSLSVEALSSVTNIQTWGNDEDAFALLDEFCETKGYQCNSEEFLTLKNELDELNSAHTELKAVLTAYNEDPALLEQLTNIERQRTDLLKTLFAKI